MIIQDPLIHPYEIRGSIESDFQVVSVTPPGEGTKAAAEGRETVKSYGFYVTVEACLKKIILLKAEEGDGPITLTKYLESVRSLMRELKSSKIFIDG